MKAHYKTQMQSGRITFELEGQTPKDMFQAISDVESLFDIDTMCGCCHSSNIGHRVRVSQENEFFELYCKDCTAALTFHQRRTGGMLYVPWEERKGNNRGWKIWKKGAAAAPGAEQPEPKDEEVPF